MGFDSKSSSSRQFTTKNLQQILETTFIQAVDYHDTVASTNNLALQTAARYDGPLPLLIVTEQQTGGRGRGSNTWWSSQGALTFSVMLDAGPLALPVRCWPQASLATGLSVCEAVEHFLRPAQAGVKWPNDVWVGGRKLCGILVEAPPDASERLVLGIGINVNNSALDAPPELQETAVAMCDVSGANYQLTDVLSAVLLRLAHWLPRVARQDPDMLAAWKERCVLKGRGVTVDQDVRAVSGRCLGIDADGALLVDTTVGVERLLSGVVGIMPEDAIPRPPIARR
ncbi:MAG: biotin--[acetyl-CoA-carboxylase] ligase [Planctomycetales bacterium]|nr:biotin--[acetyl-CoA-carboxylase] ligase [Planctomycetales bacterium]